MLWCCILARYIYIYISRKKARRGRRTFVLKFFKYRAAFFSVSDAVSNNINACVIFTDHANYIFTSHRCLIQSLSEEAVKSFEVEWSKMLKRTSIHFWLRRQIGSSCRLLLQLTNRRNDTNQKQTSTKLLNRPYVFPRSVTSKQSLQTSFCTPTIALQQNSFKDFTNTIDFLLLFQLAQFDVDDELSS